MMTLDKAKANIAALAEMKEILDLVDPVMGQKIQTLVDAFKDAIEYVEKMEGKNAD